MTNRLDSRNILRISTVLKDSDKVWEKRENAIVQSDYKCQTKICDFAKSILDIGNCIELGERRSTCKQIIKTLSDNQHEFCSDQLDGIFISTRECDELVYLHNNSSQCTNTTAVITYQDSERKDRIIESRRCTLQ